MAEKKRKGAASGPAPPTKKSKKSPASESISKSTSEVNQLATTLSTTNDAVKKSKTVRKRAADFLDGDENEKEIAPVVTPAEPEKPSKKSKHTAALETTPANRKKDKKATLTADGINGVVENGGTAEVGVVTAKDPATGSLEAEGLRTVDRELEEENASDDEDQGAALLAGFDSDNEDTAEDQGDMSRTQPIPQFKKTSKKLKQAKERGSDGPGTVYVGRIPHGFYEKQMREYFAQFGTISRLRLSRNKRTGASKHFAFIEFESDEVAKIVADTMDNYLMFGHILKCKYAPSENLHPDVWKGANKKYRKIPHDKLQRQQLEAPKTQEQWTKKNEKEKKKREQQAEKMKAIGYEYVVPQLKNPADVIEQRGIEQRKEEQEHGVPAIESATDEHPNPIEAPPSVPADEVALKKEKKDKKEKKEKKPKKLKVGDATKLTEGNLDAKNAGPAAESAKVTQNEAKLDNDVTALDNTEEPAAAPKKRSRKVKKENSAISNDGELESLASIPVGTEAAPPHVTDAVPAAAQDEEAESLFTHNGVADAVLAGRKSDRKKARPAKRSKSSKQEGEAEPADGPGVGDSDKKKKKEKEKEKDKKPKGILKKGKMA